MNRSSNENKPELSFLSSPSFSIFTFLTAFLPLSFRCFFACPASFFTLSQVYEHFLQIYSSHSLFSLNQNKTTFRIWRLSGLLSVSGGVKTGSFGSWSSANSESLSFAGSKKSLTPSNLFKYTIFFLHAPKNMADLDKYLTMNHNYSNTSFSSSNSSASGMYFSR